MLEAVCHGPIGERAKTIEGKRENVMDGCSRTHGLNQEPDDCLGLRHLPELSGGCGQTLPPLFSESGCRRVSCTQREHAEASVLQDGKGPLEQA